MSAEASGRRTKGWARIPMLGVAGSSEEWCGKYDKHLDVKHPDWQVDAIGPNLYQATVAILREIGHYSRGRKINSR